MNYSLQDSMRYAVNKVGKVLSGNLSPLDRWIVEVEEEMGDEVHRIDTAWEDPKAYKRELRREKKAKVSIDQILARMKASPGYRELIQKEWYWLNSGLARY